MYFCRNCKDSILNCMVCSTPVNYKLAKILDSEIVGQETKNALNNFINEGLLSNEKSIVIKLNKVNSKFEVA